MAGSRDVWGYRDSMDARMAKMEAHVENIYHHVKRIDLLLEKQNGRIRTNEGVISRWKGIAVGIVCIASFISTVIAMIIN